MKVPSAQDLEPIAFYKNGEVCSFTTAKQRELLAAFSREMTLIPTTARDADAFGRVDIAFKSYSIIDFGGVILLPDGTVDETWLNMMRIELAAAYEGLLRAKKIIDDYATSKSQKGRARLVTDFGIPFYTLIKDPDKQIHHLADIEQDALVPWLASAEGNQFSIHRNANNLAVLPRCLDKSRAVNYVRQKLESEYGEILTFGMGDSLSDARFMTACDYAILPRNSQLAAKVVTPL